MRKKKIDGIVGIYKANKIQALVINGCIFKINTEDDLISFKNNYPYYYYIYKTQNVMKNIIYMLNKDVELDNFARFIEQEALEKGYINELEIINNPLQIGYFDDFDYNFVKKLK